MFKREFHFFRKDFFEPNAVDISQSTLKREIRFPLLLESSWILLYPSSQKAFLRQKERCLMKTSISVGRISNFMPSWEWEEFPIRMSLMHFENERGLKSVVTINQFIDKVQCSLRKFTLKYKVWVGFITFFTSRAQGSGRIPHPVYCRI